MQIIEHGAALELRLSKKKGKKFPQKHYKPCIFRNAVPETAAALLCITRCACGEPCSLLDLVQTGEFFCLCGRNSGVGFGDCPTFSGMWYCHQKTHTHNYPTENQCGRMSHVAVVKHMFLNLLHTLAAELFRFFSPNPASNSCSLPQKL